HAYALGRLRIVESLGDDAGADGELPGEIDAFTGGDIMQGQEVAPERVITRFERACCRQEQFGSPVISHAVLPGSHAVVIVVTVAYAGTKVRPSSTPVTGWQNAPKVPFDLASHAKTVTHREKTTDGYGGSNPIPVVPSVMPR